MGKSHFSYITCHGMYLYYNDTSEEINTPVLLINDHHQKYEDYCIETKLIQVYLLQNLIK